MVPTLLEVSENLGNPSMHGITAKSMRLYYRRIPSGYLTPKSVKFRRRLGKLYSHILKRGFFVATQVETRTISCRNFLEKMVWRISALLQSRQKWTLPCKNLAVGDIVQISTENSPRNTWPLRRVFEVLLDRKGLVRCAKVKVKRTVVERPIDKLCLHLEAWAFPPKWLSCISRLHLIEDSWKRYLELIQLKHKCFARTPHLGAGM